jgi:hypothetical protein
MGAPRICVAGIEPTTARHVRPVTGKANPLTRPLLGEEGGPFEIGARVELGELTPRPSPPEIEDQLFWPERARRVAALSDEEYLELVDSVCEDDLESIFGEELVRDGWTLTVPAGRGIASLGCVRVAPGDAELSIGREDKITLRLRAPEKPYFLKVTDVRCCQADHRTPRRDVIDDAQRRIRRGVPLRVMVGLTRPWSPDGENERHWLQVNGLCLEDSPLGSVP